VALPPTLPRSGMTVEMRDGECFEHVQLRLWADMERSHRDAARIRSSSRSRTSPQGRASFACAARWAAKRSSMI
jgi:hypothetical protein